MTAKLGFGLAGIAGGCAVWTDAAVATPAVFAIGAGVGVTRIATAVVQRRFHVLGPGTAVSGWTWWGLGGGLTTAIAYLAEYGWHAPGLRISGLHPLLALGWTSAGVLLDHVAHPTRGSGVRARVRERAIGLGAVLLVAATGIAAAAPGADGLWGRDPMAGQLARTAASGVSPHVFASLRDAKSPLVVFATLVPLLVIGVGGWTACRRDARSSAGSAALVSLLATSCVLALWALPQARVMNVLQAVLLAIVAALLGGRLPLPRAATGALSLLVILGVVLGAAVSWPRGVDPESTELTRSQVTRLFERDLAHWLNLRAGERPVTVLAPPATSVALVHHGGMRGVCSLAPQNKDGFAAAVRIVASTTPEEARTLIERRGITHLVFPSWDPTLDRYAGFGLGASPDSAALDRTFLVRLRRGVLPDWLRAIPQQLPRLPGLPPHSVAVFEVVEEQEHAAALSRLAECYVELGEPGRAAPLLDRLRQYPGDLGARAALVHVAAAQGERGALAHELEAIRSLLAAGADDALVWDRRLSLAVVLAQARQGDGARVQLARCFAEADEEVLRAATAGELYKLLTLGRRFGLRFALPELDALALALLPPEFRRKL